MLPRLPHISTVYAVAFSTLCFRRSLPLDICTINDRFTTTPVLFYLLECTKKLYINPPPSSGIYQDGIVSLCSRLIMLFMWSYVYYIFRYKLEGRGMENIRSGFFFHLFHFFFSTGETNIFFYQLPLDTPTCVLHLLKVICTENRACWAGIRPSTYIYKYMMRRHYMKLVQFVSGPFGMLGIVILEKRGREGDVPFRWQGLIKQRVTHVLHPNS